MVPLASFLLLEFYRQQSFLTYQCQIHQQIEL